MSTKNQIKSRAALVAWVGAVVAWVPPLVWGLWSLLQVGLVVATTMVALLAAWWAWLRTPRQVMAWRNWRADQKGGFASSLDIVRRSGRIWLYRRAVRIRPSLAGASVWERWVRTHWSQLGPRIMQVGTGFGRLWVYCSYELFRVVVAGPRAGKTALTLNEVLDAPGAVVATSTKAEIISVSRALRERRGPVWIFNPDGLGTPDCASNFRWNPLSGCGDPVVAQRRAGYLMSGSKSVTGIGAENFWSDQGVRALGMFLHAAALGKRTLLDVERWLSRLGDADDQAEIREYLSTSPVAASMLSDYGQLAGTNTNTATSTTTTITTALQWLKQPSAAALVDAGVDEGFDVDELINRGGTLYLIAKDREHGGVGPLFTALAGYVYDGAVERASRMPRGKLDPPLCMVLDEAANICALPLQKMSGDMTGQGVAATGVFQSRDQIRAKWGEDAAGIIWQNAGTKILMGGNDDADELDQISRLFGEVKDREGGKGARKRALSVERLRALEELEAVVIRRAMGATIGSIVPYWERPDVKAQAKADREQARKAVESSRVPVWQRMLPARPHVETPPVPAPRTEDDDLVMWREGEGERHGQ